MTYILKILTENIAKPSHGCGMIQICYIKLFCKNAKEKCKFCQKIELFKTLNDRIITIFCYKHKATITDPIWYEVQLIDFILQEFTMQYLYLRKYGTIF